MNRLEELLESEAYVLLDGAMGTMLIAAGLEAGNPTEVWNVLHPEKVRAVHRAYIDAGSRLILTNSFGGNRLRLARHNLQARSTELNRAAAANARLEADSAPHLVVVAGSIGPTGELLQPVGSLTYDEAKSAFAEQSAALAEGGVDLIWIETMSDLNEVRAAVEGTRSVCDLPVAATMTFDTHGRTMMGVRPSKAVEALTDLTLMAVGANCGNGPQEIETVIETMRTVKPDTLLIAKANAGLPKRINRDIVYDGTPEVMAEYACHVRDLGARLIGGCCGSTPDHIRAMAKALGTG